MNDKTETNEIDWQPTVLPRLMDTLTDEGRARVWEEIQQLASESANKVLLGLRAELDDDTRTAVDEAMAKTAVKSHMEFYIEEYGFDTAKAKTEDGFDLEMLGDSVIAQDGQWTVAVCAKYALVKSALDEGKPTDDEFLALMEEKGWAQTPESTFAEIFELESQ